jgi:hypothetical protein
MGRSPAPMSFSGSELCFPFEFRDALADMVELLLQPLSLRSEELGLLLWRRWRRVSAIWRSRWRAPRWCISEAGPTGHAGSIVLVTPTSTTAPSSSTAPAHTETTTGHWVCVAGQVVAGAIAAPAASHGSHSTRSSSISCWHLVHLLSVECSKTLLITVDLAFTTIRGPDRAPSPDRGPPGLAPRNPGLCASAGGQSHRRPDSHHSAVAPRVGRGRGMDRSRRIRGCMDCTTPVLRRSSVPFRLVQYHQILAFHSPPFYCRLAISLLTTDQIVVHVLCLRHVWVEPGRRGCACVRKHALAASLGALCGKSGHQVRIGQSASSYALAYPPALHSRTVPHQSRET